MAADPRTHLFSNNAAARLASSLSSIATTIELEPGAGDLFPSPGSGEIFKLTVEDIIEGKREIMHCTARSGDTLTVERAQEDTSAQQFTNLTNTTVQIRVTAGTLDYLAGDGEEDNPCEFQLSCSDLTTDISTGVSKAYFRAPHGFSITDIRASLLTAGTTASTIDVNVDGESILSTALTIDADEKTSTTAGTPVVVSEIDVGDDSEITIDIDEAGTGAKGLIVTIIGTRS